jgi:DNA polymerase III subunit alpha, Gram-positive type
MKQFITIFYLTMISILTNAETTNESYTNQIFAAVDVETTGFNARNNKIVEIAAVKFKNGKIIDKKTWLVNPEINIPYVVQNVHGISNKMVENQPDFSVVGTNFIDFVGDSILIAHNATFDAGFIYTEMKRNNIDRIKNPFLDSLKMARIWYPELKKHNLKYLTEHLGFEGEKYHRALEDSIYVQMFFVDGLKKKMNLKI